MHKDLTFEELDRQHVELLPTREPLGRPGQRLGERLGHGPRRGERRGDRERRCRPDDPREPGLTAAGAVLTGAAPPTATISSAHALALQQLSSVQG